MDHFYVITNPAKDADLKVTHFIRDYLIKQGKTCVIDTGGAFDTLSPVLK